MLVYLYQQLIELISSLIKQIMKIPPTYETINDQSDHLTPQREAPYKNYTSSVDSKSLMEQLMQNLDKILVGILIVLLVVFLFHSSSKVQKKYEAQKISLLLDNLDQQSSSPKQLQDKKPFKDLISQLQQEDDIKSPQVKVVEITKAEIDGKRQEEKQQEVINRRYLGHRKRSRYFQQKSRQQDLSLLKLSKYNLDDPQSSQQQKRIRFEQQQKRLQEKYKISEYKSKELSMCVVVHASSHKKNYAHQYVLNSIFNQQYQNYIVVYIADGFSADQVSTIKQFVKGNGNKKKVRFVWNAQRKYFLESTVAAVKAFCMEKRVTVLMDGDDELLGGQVFKLLNTAYRKYNANMVYGNFIEYHQDRVQLILGFSNEYQDSQKKDNLYRSVGQKFGSIKTFKTGLISYIKENDLKDKTGHYYRFAGDYALMYPLIELSCGQVKYLPEYNYLYFGYEIDPTFGNLQISNGREIREKSRYDCYKKYN